jgi:hypothetical protein
MNHLSESINMFGDEMDGTTKDNKVAAGDGKLEGKITN